MSRTARAAVVKEYVPPTPEQIADRAYAAMRKPPQARADAAHLATLNATERAIWLASQDADRRAAAIAYALRRRELAEVYSADAGVMQAREDRLAWLRASSPALKSADRIAWVKRYYSRDAATMADFINDWGYTIDPRLIEKGRNPIMAFSLFPKQRELIAWMLGCWIDSKPGVVVKSRDVGASWVAMALLATLCIFRTGFAAGVGSAVEIKIDRTGDPDTLFYKIRSFLEHLPPEFCAGYSEDKCSADKRVSSRPRGRALQARQAIRRGAAAVSRYSSLTSRRTSSIRKSSTRT